MRKTRIITYDIIKIISCIFVVGIHTFPNVGIYNILLSIERVSVPFFFGISGYLYYQMNYNSKRKYFKKLLIIYLISNSLYILLNGISNFSIFNLFVKFFITGTRQHLWYIVALIEIVFIHLIFDNYKKRKENILQYMFILFSVICILLFYMIVYIFGYNYNLFLILDNFIVAGGIFSSSKFIKKCNNKKKNLFSIIIYLLIYIIIINYLSIKLNFIPQNASIFLYIFVHITLSKSILLSSKENKLIIYCSNLTLYIYILHPLIKDIILKAKLVKQAGPILFFVTLITSILISFVVAIINNVVIKKLKLYKKI